MTSTGTLRVDVAAQSPKTAGCVIEWDDRGYGCALSFGGLPRLGSACQADRRAVTRVAIDAPFGWQAIRQVTAGVR